MKPRLSQRLSTWINERFPAARFLSACLHEEIPGGTRFSYTLGSSCLFLFILQVLTGVWQMFFYVPTIDYAYSSLNYLRFEVPFGWLIHGLHYWGAHAFTVVVGLHVIRVFIWGAYKKPRELVWLAGVVLLILTTMFMFTGPILPWDKKGYWAAQVGLNMAGSAPGIGPWLQALLQGSSKLGQIALTRLYVIHVALLPFFTALFVVVHLVAFRVYGSIGPWREEGKRKPKGEFWPEQLFKDALVWYAIFILLVGLSAFKPAPLSGLADPMDTLYTPKPEWNFLFLYECLKYFSGPLEPIGTVGIPLLIILLFLSLPFLDRSPERDPLKRGFVMLCGFLFMWFVAGMTWQGYHGNPPEDEQAKTRLKMMKETDRILAEKGIEDEQKGVSPPGAQRTRKLDGEEDISGEKLFKVLGCGQCHGVDGKNNNKLGPDLKIVLNKDVSREWLWAQLVAPQKHNPLTIMPLYGHLSDYKLNVLIDYLQGLVADKSEPSARQTIAAGEKLFTSLGCTECHTATGGASPDGTIGAGHKKGPDLVVALRERKISKDWLYAQLVNPQKHNLSTIMPSYTKLDEHQVEVLIVFLEDLSKRKSKPQNEQIMLTPKDTKSSEEPSQKPILVSQEEDFVESPQESADAQKGLGASIHIVGNEDHGRVLFQQYCMRCHGPEGKVNPSDVSVLPGVPSIHPIKKEWFSADPVTFVRNIDPVFQHGAKNEAGGPDMPAYGDTHELTQAQIADLEAYVLSLNKVRRTQIINPGMDPESFFFLLIKLSLVGALVLGIYAWNLRRNRK